MQFYVIFSIYTQGTILSSKGETREKYEKNLIIPHLPDMLFAENHLTIMHKSGFGITFNPYDALKLVDPKGDLIKVKVAKEWKESRSDCEFVDKQIHPFDWTFTTTYKGTLIENHNLKLIQQDSKERINIERLKIQESISFFDEISLFEDELSDHGISSLNVKIRVMPTSFYVLQRFFLRVDDVVLRVFDTRIYHEIENTFLIREYTEKESLVQDLLPICSPRLFTQPNEIVNYLVLKTELIEKLEFPK